jgi:hypothetical protein
MIITNLNNQTVHLYTCLDVQSPKLASYLSIYLLSIYLIFYFLFYYSIFTLETTLFVNPTTLVGRLVDGELC